MATFIMMTRLSHDTLKSPKSLQHLSEEVMEHIRKECPEVQWKQSFVVLGPADYLDIFDAPNVEAATKVAALIRTYGHAHTEVWGATEWDKFVSLVSPMSESRSGKGARTPHT